MRVVGINIIGNDHAIALWDSKTDYFFAISLERITRIKHDKKGLLQIKKEYPEIFSEIDLVCVGSTGDDGRTISMNRKLISTLKNQNLIYETFKPRFIKEEKALYQNLKNNFIKLGINNVIKFFKNKIRKRLSSNKNSHTEVEKYIKSFFNKSSKVVFYEHHYSHAASAYFYSPYKLENNVLVVSIDGFGDGLFSKAYVVNNGVMDSIRESNNWVVTGASTTFKFFSLGILYANFTEAMDLQVNSEEGKVEALAAFGNFDNEIYHKLNKSILIQDGVISGLPGVEKFYDLEWLKMHREKIGKENFCAAIQEFLNNSVLTYLKQLKEITKTDTLCLAGGVVANVIANLKIYESDIFSNIFIVPSMADDGTAIGALAIGAIENNLDFSKNKFSKMPYWGPEIKRNDIEKELFNYKDFITYQYKKNWQEDISNRLKEGQIGALVQGKMEFGPRALGNRSIIASPIFAEMVDKINLNIKKRPKYQPFCPSCLEEERERLFIKSYPNKHMTAAFRLKKEFANKIPSACHIDLTARPQFVDKTDNPDFYKLLVLMKEKTGYGILINTSFNKHGRTIVRTAKDSIIDFLDCKLDFLILGDYLITRKN